MEPVLTTDESLGKSCKSQNFSPVLTVSSTSTKVRMKSWSTHKQLWEGEKERVWALRERRQGSQFSSPLLPLSRVPSSLYCIYGGTVHSPFWLFFPHLAVQENGDQGQCDILARGAGEKKEWSPRATIAHKIESLSFPSFLPISRGKMNEIARHARQMIRENREWTYEPFG